MCEECAGRSRRGVDDTPGVPDRDGLLESTPVPLTEDEFADLLAQVAGIPYEVEALPRKHGLAARGLTLSDRLDEDLGIDSEMRTELAAAAVELLGDAQSDDIHDAVESAHTVGDLWQALSGEEASD